MSELLSHLDDYDVSMKYGFLPASPPLKSLPSPHYRAWEMTAANLAHLIDKGTLRECVKAIPVLPTDYLSDENEWRRAYVILGFLCNGYLFGGLHPCERLPLSLSQPLIAVSDHLGLPPVPTYSGQCLWNYQLCSETNGPLLPSHIRTQISFTGSLEESYFFGISVAIEACGAPIVSTMLNGIEAARKGYQHQVAECLLRATDILMEMTSLLPSMYENCSPTFFFNRLRPYLEGTRDLAPKGLPHGVFYEESYGGEYRKYRGPNNAQSSLFAFVDIALGIQHFKATQNLEEAQSISSAQEDTVMKTEFLQEMRQYMPRGHRDFLNQVDRVSNIRSFVGSNPGNVPLCASYDGCLAQLARFRQRHIQMVTRYIVIMSRRQSAPGKSTQENRKIGDDSASGGPRGAAARGTGGTRPIEFLKSVRDAVLHARHL